MAAAAQTVDVCGSAVSSLYTASSTKLADIAGIKIVGSFCKIANFTYNLGDLLFQDSFLLVLLLASTFFGIKLAADFMLAAMGVQSGAEAIRNKLPEIMWTAVGLAFFALGATGLLNTMKTNMINPLIGLTTSFSVALGDRVASMEIAGTNPCYKVAPTDKNPAGAGIVAPFDGAKSGSIISAEYLGRLACIVTMTITPIEIAFSMWQGTPSASDMQSAINKMTDLNCDVMQDFSEFGLNAPGQLYGAECKAAQDKIKLGSGAGATTVGAVRSSVQGDLDTKRENASFFFGSTLSDLFKMALYAIGCVLIFVIYVAILGAAVFTNLGFVYQLMLLVFLSPCIFGAFISKTFKEIAIKIGRKFLSIMVATVFLSLTLAVMTTIMNTFLIDAAGSKLAGVPALDAYPGYSEAAGAAGIVKRIEIERIVLSFSPTAYGMSFGSSVGTSGYIILLLGGFLALIMIPMTLRFTSEVLGYGGDVLAEGKQLFTSALKPALAATAVGAAGAGFLAAKGIGMVGGWAGKAVGGGYDLAKEGGSSMLRAATGSYQPAKAEGKALKATKGPNDGSGADGTSFGSGKNPSGGGTTLPGPIIATASGADAGKKGDSSTAKPIDAAKPTDPAVKRTDGGAKPTDAASKSLDDERKAAAAAAAASVASRNSAFGISEEEEQLKNTNVVANEAEPTKTEERALSAVRDQQFAGQTPMSAAEAKAISPQEMSIRSAAATDSLKAGNPAPMTNLGSVQALRGDRAGAVSSWTQAAATGLSPSASANLNMAGNAYKNEGQSSKAIETWQAAARVQISDTGAISMGSGGSSGALNSLGVAQYSLGGAANEKSGREMIRASMKEGNAQAAYNMGFIQQHAGNQKTASNYFETGAKLASGITDRATSGIVAMADHTISMGEMDGSTLTTTHSGAQRGMASIGRATTSSAPAAKVKLQNQQVNYEKLISHGQKMEITDVTPAFDMSRMQRRDA
jgi:hypothetical protein